MSTFNKIRRIIRSEIDSHSYVTITAAISCGVFTTYVSSLSRKNRVKIEASKLKANISTSMKLGNYETKKSEFARQERLLMEEARDIPHEALNDAAVAALFVGVFFWSIPYAIGFSTWYRRMKLEKRSRAIREKTSPVRRITIEHSPADQELPHPLRATQPVLMLSRPISYEPNKNDPPEPSNTSLELSQRTNQIPDEQKQILYELLLPRLGDISGLVVRTLEKMLTLDEFARITTNLDAFQQFLHENSERLNTAFAAEGIGLPSIMRKLVWDASATQKIVKQKPVAPDQDIEMQIAELNRSITLLGHLRMRKGVKVSNFISYLRHAGFSVETHDNRGNGHPILIWKGEIVRAPDGRPRYLPHDTGVRVLDIVLTEVVDFGTTFLEAKKHAVEQANIKGPEQEYKSL